MMQGEIETGQDDKLFSLGFSAILRRDIRVYYRYRGAWMNPLVFVVMVITLFAVGVAGDRGSLSTIAAAVLWVVALLAILLSLDALFRSDYDDGSLEQMMLFPGALYYPVLAKVLAHWLVTGMPLLLASPLLAAMLSIPVSALPAMMASLLLGSGLLSFIGSIGAALTVSLRAGGLLMALLVLPLCIPVVVFGTHIIQSAIDGWPVAGSLAMLAGLLSLAILISPIATQAALRVSIENA